MAKIRNILDMTFALLIFCQFGCSHGQSVAEVAKSAVTRPLKARVTIDLHRNMCGYLRGASQSPPAQSRLKNALGTLENLADNAQNPYATLKDFCSILERNESVVHKDSFHDFASWIKATKSSDLGTQLPIEVWITDGLNNNSSGLPNVGEFKIDRHFALGVVAFRSTHSAFLADAGGAGNPATAERPIYIFWLAPEEKRSEIQQWLIALQMELGTSDNPPSEALQLYPNIRRHWTADFGFLSPLAQLSEILLPALEAFLYLSGDPIPESVQKCFKWTLSGLLQVDLKLKCGPKEASRNFVSKLDGRARYIMRVPGALGVSRRLVATSINDQFPKVSAFATKTCGLDVPEYKVEDSDCSPPDQVRNHFPPLKASTLSTLDNPEAYLYFSVSLNDHKLRVKPRVSDPVAIVWREEFVHQPKHVKHVMEVFFRDWSTGEITCNDERGCLEVANKTYRLADWLPDVAVAASRQVVQHLENASKTAASEVRLNISWEFDN